MIPIRTLMLLASCLLLAAPAGAQVDLKKLAQSTMNFQLVSLSARASALGEAVYASSAGAEAIYFNPAGMVDATRTLDAGVFYTRWIADIDYFAGAVVQDFGSFGSVGLSAMGVDYGTLNATRLVSSSSSVVYEEVGEMPNVGAWSFGVTYARAINTQFSIGGTVRYTGQSLGQSLLASGVKDNDAWRFVFDMGVKYNTGFRSFSFGMALRNFSSQVKREEIEEQLPLTFNFGVAANLLEMFSPGGTHESALNLGLDYLHSNNYTERVNMGLEYTVLGAVALRGGYQTNRDAASWSAGVGVFTTFDGRDIRVDYSYSQMDLFDGVSRFSLGFGI
jgi:hypothetical protein